MGIKYSTGRKTKMKYSTGMDWEEYKKKRRRSRVGYSTGQDANIAHASGTLSDGMSQTEEEEVLEEKKDGKPKAREYVVVERPSKEWKKMPLEY